MDLQRAEYPSMLVSFAPSLASLNDTDYPKDAVAAFASYKDPS
jgi:hypothetical protein